jgi:hypothetical protein
MQLISVLKIVMIILLFSSGQALAWTVAANFENGTVGAKAVSASGFTDAGAQTVVTSGIAANGSKSAKMTWHSGDTGFSNNMGYIDYPNIGYGSEIWARGYFYFASPWSWTCSPVIKIFRIHVADSGGGNLGYISIFAGPSGEIMYSNEVSGLSGFQDSGSQYGTGAYFNTNTWQCFELYIKFSNTTPIVRMWKDGVLITTATTWATMGASNHYSDFSYIMSYWNGGVPQNQTQYVDEFIITNEMPSQVDSKGNPMIGPINGQSVGAPQNSTPKAPSGLKSLPN